MRAPVGGGDRRLLDELLRVAGILGIGVRIERFETPPSAGGSSCVLRGERLVLLDARAPIREQQGALARALAAAGTDAVFMMPEAREAVEAARLDCARPAADASVGADRRRDEADHAREDHP